MKKKSRSNDSVLMDLVQKLDPEMLNQLLELSKNTQIIEAKKKHLRQSKGLEKRPIDSEEYEKIISLISHGFIYEEKGVTKNFKPNIQIAMALTIQANLGLKISEVLQLKVIDFEIGSVNNKKLHENITHLVKSYAKKKNLKLQDYVITTTIRNVQKGLKIAADHLGLMNIGTESFRKFYAMEILKTTNDIELVRNLLNHSNLRNTQRYLKINQRKIEEISSAVDFTSTMKSHLEGRKDENNE